MESELAQCRTPEESAARIEQLSAQVSKLEEENANLRLLDDVMRRNNALFEALLANSGVGIALTGPDRRIVRIVRGLTGYGNEKVVGKLVEGVVIPEDRPTVVECYRLLMTRSKQKVRCKVRVLRADGALRWFSVTLTDMLDNPDVQGIIWNYYDITAKMQPGAGDS